MVEKDSFSIFDVAGKKAKKASASRGFAAAATDTEVKEMIERMQIIKNDLQYKLHNVIKKSGKDPKQFFDYYDDPKNFSKEYWDRMQVDISSYKKTLMLPDEKSTVKEAAPKSDKVLQKELKARKGKTLGSRKNWLPMR